MFGRSGYSRAISSDINEIERRLRSLESHLERLGGRASAGVARSADHVGDAIATTFQNMADRLRRRVGPAGAEARKFGHETLHRIADETKRRPLIMIAVAAVVGAILGLATHRR
jgi:ElaB/YqjD/DUF883 family membrane-anchored ribosome-binding protein